MRTNEQYWSYNTSTGTHVKTENEAFSIFPTVVEPQKKVVFCRRCHRWEYIIRFQKNLLVSQCGTVYKPPFVLNNTLINYGYTVRTLHRTYDIKVKSQIAGITERQLLENDFTLNLNEKTFYKNGQLVFDTKDIGNYLCKELTDSILNDISTEYKTKFGYSPTIASSLGGFNVIIGYMLAPYNINFYRIAKFWGLNPFNKNFTYLASGETPTAENEMFDSLDIKPTKTVRREYQKNPYYVICYAVTKDLGFTDVNILQKSYSKAYYNFLDYNMLSFAGGDTTYAIRMPLKHFVEDLLALSNQKTVWNSIQRTVEYFDTLIETNVVIDGINAYDTLREYLTDNEKKEVMREGFNLYTHDYLVRRLNQLNLNTSKKYEEENLVFEIEQKFLDLEFKTGEERTKVFNPQTGKEEYVPTPDEDRYCFYVARDSETLKIIGSEMHNCVGWGYKHSVRDRHCTIVYAMYKNKYRICIEVTPDFSIRQSLGPCNKPLEGEDLLAYSEWCKERHIKFTKAFKVHTAL